MKTFRASTKLVRLISARCDISESIDAWSTFVAFPEHPSNRYFFAMMVVAYGRPFFENYKVGRLQCDYPNFPDFKDEEMNMRHRRMLDLRNKFVAHSSAEGTLVMVVPPGVVNPVTGSVIDRFDHNIGKRTFDRPEYASWLVEVAYAVRERLETDIRSLMEVELAGVSTDQPFELSTGFEDFSWTG
jgi:hypothetical protein